MTTTVFEIVDSNYYTHHIAMSSETAYFLRDWCQAIADDNGVDEHFSVYADEAFA